MSNCIDDYGDYKDDFEDDIKREIDEDIDGRTGSVFIDPVARIVTQCE